MKVRRLHPLVLPEIQASEWESYLPTPPFPSYVSGHSAFTASWARAMELATGPHRSKFPSDCEAFVRRATGARRPGDAVLSDLRVGGRSKWHVSHLGWNLLANG
jgi:hypothetical protein